MPTCSCSRRSHALLPDFLLERRLDEVHVIGHALALSIISGLGMRPVAEQLGVPMTTARGRRRRFRVRALVLTTALVALAVHVDPAAVLAQAADHEPLRWRRWPPPGSAPARASVLGLPGWGASGA